MTTTTTMIIKRAEEEHAKKSRDEGEDWSDLWCVISKEGTLSSSVSSAFSSSLFFSKSCELFFFCGSRGSSIDGAKKKLCLLCVGSVAPVRI
jgi:hypothetical protein